MKRYNSYKLSGTNWIGEVPEHWDVLPFKVLFTTDKGLNITKADLVDEGEPVISYGQIHSKLNDYVSVKDDLIRFLPKTLAPQNSKSLVHEGDFIFADTSEDLEGCGNCVYIDREGVFAGYHTIIARHKAQTNNKYLAYLFTTPYWRSQIRSKVFGVKVYSITKQILTSTSLIVPPMYEQCEIVAYLDTRCADIDKVIATQQKRIALLQELKQSEITKAVTRGLNPDVKMKDSGVEWIGEVPENWEVKRIKYTGTFGNGLTYSPKDVCEEGVLVIRSSNIQGGKLTLEDNVFVKEAPSDLMVKKGDIIICSRNGSAALVGKSCYIEEDINATFGAFMMRYKPSINTKYGSYLIQITIGNYKGLFATTTINQLTKDMLSQMFVPVACKDEQAEIVEYLDCRCCEIDKQIASVTKQIKLLQEYKQSLITEAVTGKIKVS